jgi:small GTP-binding protein
MDSTSIEEKKDMLSLKIVLVGCSTVGKSALINQYINNKFLETQILTIGCDKFTKVEKIKNLDIKINLWDTAGQERFRSLSHLFLKGANIVLMVYDITNQDSFNELKQFWIERVNDNTKNIILGIIANKSDLYENEVVSINDGSIDSLKAALSEDIGLGNANTSLLS